MIFRAKITVIVVIIDKVLRAKLPFLSTRASIREYRCNILVKEEFCNTWSLVARVGDKVVRLEPFQLFKKCKKSLTVMHIASIDTIS